MPTPEYSPRHNVDASAASRKNGYDHQTIREDIYLIGSAAVQVHSQQTPEQPKQPLRPITEQPRPSTDLQQYQPTEQPKQPKPSNRKK